MTNPANRPTAKRSERRAGLFTAGPTWACLHHTDTTTDTTDMPTPKPTNRARQAADAAVSALDDLMEVVYHLQTGYPDAVELHSHFLIKQAAARLGFVQLTYDDVTALLTESRRSRGQA